MLCQHERRIINEALSRVEREDKEQILLALLAMARYPSLHYTTEDRFISIMVTGLLPFVEQSLRKANDPNYLAAYPDDAPTGSQQDKQKN